MVMPNSKDVVLSVYPEAYVEAYKESSAPALKFSIKNDGKWLPAKQSMTAAFSPNQAWDNLVKNKHFREDVITRMASSLNKFLNDVDSATMLEPPKAVEVSDSEATIPTELKHKIPESETLSRDW
jgi:hypothetical protein